ncbi:MAG: Hsp20/alpha crystallin family protein [Athalassotoga sp.]|uniref:Hsp20/alpha crystallin family protein n=1 Tax=Athalassotoga sp. TaxID=2022597 RepID=UPI003D08BB8A
MAIEKRKESEELDIYRPFEEMQKVIDRFFEEFPRIWPTTLSAETFVPAVDISETDKSYEFEVELPGMKREDVNIEIDDGILTIRGEKKEERKEEKKGYKKIERSYGKFERSFSLPSDIDEKNISAKFENGVLNISIPKSPEAKSAKRKIEIK